MGLSTDYTFREVRGEFEKITQKPVKAIILPESMFPPLEWVIRGVIVGIWSHSVVPHPNCWGVVTISGPLGPFSKPSSTVVPHEEKASKSEISHA